MRSNKFIKIGLLLVMVSILTSAANYLHLTINKYNDEVNEGKKIEEEVVSLYDNFQTSLSLYISKLSNTYNSFDLYLEDIPKINNDILNNINKVNEAEKELENISNSLNEKCSNNLTTGVFLSRCDYFKENINKVNETYNKMIEDYNSIVDKYNEYAETENLEKINKIEQGV